MNKNLINGIAFGLSLLGGVLGILAGVVNDKKLDIMIDEKVTKGIEKKLSN